jgi:SARP family transcriptional regulator, regulator of embCAB operon
MTTLQTYVGTIRRHLSDVLDSPLNAITTHILRTIGGGYCLDVESTGLDLTMFTSMLTQARVDLRSGRHIDASASLREALSLWRGPALSDVAVGSRLAAYAASLEEHRLAAQRDLFQTEIILGNHHDVVGGLVETTLQHPYHEELHWLLALAMHRSGRRHDALSVVASLRNRMVSDLGLDLTQNMVALQHAILNGDPGQEHDLHQRTD